MRRRIELIPDLLLHRTAESQIAERTLRLAHALEPEHRQPELTLPERQPSGS